MIGSGRTSQIDSSLYPSGTPTLTLSQLNMVSHKALCWVLSRVIFDLYQ